MAVPEYESVGSIDREGANRISMTAASADNPFVFVIPVIHPDHEWVDDYRTIELLLKKTVLSLAQQEHETVHVVVICHRIPEFAAELSSSITFLNVSAAPAFAVRPAGATDRRVDKGLKLLIGILFAAQEIRPDFIMPMDADDYVNINLAQQVRTKAASSDRSVDGFTVTHGVHVSLTTSEDDKIRYRQAYRIREFDLTCGSSRVFLSARIVEHIRTISSEVEEQFSQWPPPDAQHAIVVPTESIEWLDAVTSQHYSEESSVVNALGRHISQQLIFKMEPLHFEGAAKSCGHGNHAGPRGGAVHKHRTIGLLPIDRFQIQFGLEQAGDTTVRNRNHWTELLQLPRYLVNRAKFSILVKRQRRREARAIL